MGTWYRKISRDKLNIQGYLPKFTVEEQEREEPTPQVVTSPIIDLEEDPETSEKTERTKTTISDPDPKPTPSLNTNKTFKNKEEFKRTMLPIYEKILSKMGLNTAYAKMLVAQDGLESGWGKSAQGRFNYGNITLGSNKSRSYTVGNDKDKDGNPITQKFVNYDSLEDYAQAKVQLLNSSRYRAFNGPLQEFANRVYKGGYATAPNYVEALNRVIASAKNGGILKFQAGGTGEIKADTRSWLKKQVDKIATNYNLSPFSKSAVAEVLANTSPYGVFHFAAKGDQGSAKLALLPGAVGTKAVAKEVAQAAKEGMDLIYSHYGDDITKYFKGSLENLRNPEVILSMEERLKVPKKLENIEIADDLRHDYSFFTNSTGVPTLKVSSTATNPKYVGEKAAAKQFLQELVGTTSNSGIKSMTIPEKELFVRRYGPTSTSTLSEKDIYSRLMAYKAESGITSSFEKLTEKEAKELFNKAYNSNLFHSQGESEKFWEANKDKIISIFRRIPALIGAGVISNEVIKSKKGSNTKNWSSKGMLKNEYNNPEEYYDYSNGEYDQENDRWSSREPQTGLVLKNPKHSTAFISYDADTNLGYNWYKGFDGRIYSLPIWGTNPKASNIKVNRDEISHPVSIKGFKNIKAVYNHLLALGANRKQAAGLTGVFIQESGLDHSKVSTAGAEGIAQLKGDKLKNYKKWLGNRPNTWQNQLTWLWDHINNGNDDWQSYYNNLSIKDPKLMSEKEKRDWNYMKSSKWINYSYKNLRDSWNSLNNPGDIAELFTWTFERPTEKEAKILQRRDYAQQVYNLLNK